ncbi:MAG: hypothetical protein ONB48_06795 [candidate division KSB1 bacterium]|nr:hypothetical protein [candidate division KSB1 bacterium]MDZ7273249.1 hypothetical protein [candidate division KSB1 bacterium]MDZ7285351.1 hypothetical protein [candidate division KSB1 bacterium]MDZ7298383.1 hypothetical protein [candidate division KSB1 bacterium]MDZ7306461.1 hypothetical protein [candidate division KSB1 bacterium]
MPKDDCARAIALALAGQWDEAHRLVQPHEDDDLACWIHAVLHKIEGDSGNSRYWYRRAGRMQHVNDAPDQELKQIQALLA